MTENQLGFELLNKYYGIESVTVFRQKPELENGQLLIAVSLVKNEADIIGVWLNHICYFFDIVCVVDHNSTDGTYEIIREIAEETGKLNVYRFYDPGDFQKEILHEIIKTVASEYNNAWIFPTDADEFYDFESIHQLRERVFNNGKDCILRLIWKNCMPLSLVSDQRLTPHTLILKPPYLGEYNKVAFHSSSYLANEWMISKGNHNIIDQSGKIITDIHQEDIGELLHIPIRSVDQFIYKVIRGYEGKKNLPLKSRNPNESFHIVEMMNRIIEEGMLTLYLVRDFIANYGIKTSPSDMARNKSEKNIRDFIDENWKCEYISTVPCSDIKTNVKREKYSSLIYKELINGKDQFLSKFIFALNDQKYIISSSDP